MDNIKLTEEEISQITQVQNQQSNLIQELGQISLIELNLKERKQKATDFLSNLRSQEDKLGNELEEKYGDGTINLETGEFIPQK